VVDDANNKLTSATLGLSALGSLLRRRLVDGDTEHDLTDLLHDPHAVTIETTEALRSDALITRSLKELGRRSSDAEGADVGAALELALGLARREIERKARIEVRLDQLPRVRGDQSRLGQVFLNLLLNAVEALPGGSPDQHVIAVSTRLDGRGRVVVEVSDTGPGIAPEVASRVFQPFASTKSEGSGLGLTICREILSEYGGTIDFESGTGSGTVFRVALPVDQVFASQLLAQA